MELEPYRQDERLPAAVDDLEADEDEDEQNGDDNGDQNCEFGAVVNYCHIVVSTCIKTPYKLTNKL